MAVQRDPDDVLVVLFKHLAQENPIKSLEAGRPIYDDIEVCEIRAPGSKDVKVFPATAFTRWIDDPFTGRQTKQSYAERFPHQYRQFKSHAAQTKSGTPLEHAPFLTEGKRAELRAQNVYTVEQLADIEGAELKNLGISGRELKNAAVEYIETGKSAAPSMKMMAELEALRARNAVLEEDLQAKKNRPSSVEEEFEAMSLDQLREFITTNTGQTPMGNIANMNKKTLVRMAMDCRPEKVA